MHRSTRIAIVSAAVGLSAAGMGLPARSLPVIKVNLGTGPALTPAPPGTQHQIRDALNAAKVLIGPLIPHDPRLPDIGDPPSLPTDPPDGDISTPPSQTPEELAPIRIGTMNVQWLPLSVAGGLLDGPTKDLALADELAKRVAASNYDVIAFNEVFDNTARQRIVSLLKDDYPYYVSKLDAFRRPGNSGLMLFSKLPAEAVGTPQQWLNPFRLSGRSQDLLTCDGTICGQTHYHLYKACSSTQVVDLTDDCAAAKGVGLVRLRNPADNSVINVAFTHLQSSYQGDQDTNEAFGYELNRRRQLAEAMAFVRSVVPIHNLHAEPFFLMGDLNVDGDLANPDDVLDRDKPSIQEYQDRFEDPLTRVGLDSDLPLLDTWADEIPGADLGLTNRFIWPSTEGYSGARLDYMLHTSVMPYCMSHHSLANNLRGDLTTNDSALGEPGTELGTKELSDHIGLNLDLTRPFPHCTINQADSWRVDPGKTEDISGYVEQNGSFWFKLSQPGSYAIGSVEPNTKVQLYSESDVSDPIEAYGGLRQDVTAGGRETSAAVFATPAAPVLVRVFRPDGSRGDFHVLVHRRDCSSVDEACILMPNEPAAATFPTSDSLGQADSAFFRAELDAPDDPTKLQHVSYDFATGNAAAFQMSRFDATLHVLDGPQSSEISSDERGGSTEFIVVHRGAPTGGVAQTVSVTFRTNLTVVGGAYAKALFVPVEHGDWIGDEDYYLTFFVDDRPVSPEFSLGKHPDTSPIDITTVLGTVKYVDHLAVVIREKDNFNDGIESCMLRGTDGHPDRPGKNSDAGDDDCIFFELPALSPSVTRDVPAGQANSPASLTAADDDGGGTYQFTTQRTHSTQASS